MPCLCANVFLFFFERTMISSGEHVVSFSAASLSILGGYLLIWLSCVSAESVHVIQLSVVWPYWSLKPHHFNQTFPCSANMTVPLNHNSSHICIRCDVHLQLHIWSMNWSPGNVEAQQNTSSCPVVLHGFTVKPEHSSIACLRRAVQCKLSAWKILENPFDCS